MGPDVSDQTVRMRGNLSAGRRTGRAKYEGDGPRGLGLVDMDRSVAALTMEADSEAASGAL
jgi:hypothetical protein